MVIAQPGRALALHAVFYPLASATRRRDHGAPELRLLRTRTSGRLAQGVRLAARPLGQHHAGGSEREGTRSGAASARLPPAARARGGPVTGVVRPMRWIVAAGLLLIPLRCRSGPCSTHAEPFRGLGRLGARPGSSNRHSGAGGLSVQVVAGSRSASRDHLRAFFRRRAAVVPQLWLRRRDCCNSITATAAGLT